MGDTEATLRRTPPCVSGVHPQDTAERGQGTGKPYCTSVAAVTISPFSTT